MASHYIYAQKGSARLTLRDRAQFARRDAVYWQPHSVKTPDAFLVVCTITSSPAPPVQPPSIPRLPVPRDLLFSIGTMLDDPAYSDIEFVLPRRGRSSLQGPKTIRAAKKLLQRVEYFDTSMFRFSTLHFELNVTFTSVQFRVCRSYGICDDIRCKRP